MGIGAAIGLVGVIGITLVSGTQLWLSLGDIVWNTTNTFTLVSIPLFVLMGEIILRSGISTPLLQRRRPCCCGGLPGGLAQTNIVGCAIFSAIAGSSVATAMTVGTVAIPEMRKRGYCDRLTLGTLTGGGCLGILIPPSIPMIVYASMTQVSVIDLFMAGVVPGLALAGDLHDLRRARASGPSRRSPAGAKPRASAREILAGNPRRRARDRC